MSQYTNEELENLNGITSSRHGFIFPFSVADLFEDMSYEERGQTLEAIFYYVAKGEDIYPPLNRGTLGFLTLKQFKNLYTKDAAKWLKTSQKNSDNAKKPRSYKSNSDSHDPVTGEVTSKTEPDPNKHPIYN